MAMETPFAVKLQVKRCLKVIHENENWIALEKLLSPKQRDILVLRLDGMSFNDIAIKLNYPNGLKVRNVELGAYEKLSRKVKELEAITRSPNDGHASQNMCHAI